MHAHRKINRQTARNRERLELWKEKEGGERQTE
jgi:hypothetical protein